MPVVKIFVFLELEQNWTFFKGLIQVYFFGEISHNERINCLFYFIHHKQIWQSTLSYFREVSTVHYSFFPSLELHDRIFHDHNQKGAGHRAPEVG